MKHTTGVEFTYYARCLEGFFFGLYSAIFAMYLQHHASKTDTDHWTKNILLYALCALYVFSVIIIVLDIVGFLSNVSESTVYYISISESTTFGCCDFISQLILIYRCWIVWGRNIRVVIIPSILAFIFLGTWLAATGATSISGQNVFTLDWGITMIPTSLAISMTVNALVMGLIVFKIFKVFREMKATLAEQNLGGTGGRKLRSIIFILIESGMALFSIQLARLVVTILVRTDPTDSAAYNAYLLISSIHEMLNGITPTIILVRVSMGLSFHDENSLVEATASLCFVPDHLNPVPETESIVRQDSESGDNGIGVRLSDEIQMVDG